MWIKSLVILQIAHNGVCLTVLRTQVLYLFCIETANTACDVGMMYEPLIARYGELLCILSLKSHELTSLKKALLMLPRSFPSVSLYMSLSQPFFDVYRSVFATGMPDY